MQGEQNDKNGIPDPCSQQDETETKYDEIIRMYICTYLQAHMQYGVMNCNEGRMCSYL